MEVHDGNGQDDMGVMLSDSSSTGGAATSSRWNPTKEQIVMLENMYRQGIRTPSAEQIQQITSKLREYGQIEGKNVFYWFQNHKARQRQKQKQERLDFINRYLHNAAATSPVYAPPPCPNVVCGSYYMPQISETVLYPQYQTVVLQPGAGFRKKLKSRFFSANVAGHETSAHHHSVHDQEKFGSLSSSSNCQETLPLFPLHPTGILSSSSSTSSEAASGFDHGQTFFDFFSGRCSG